MAGISNQALSCMRKNIFHACNVPVVPAPQHIMACVRECMNVWWSHVHSAGSSHSHPRVCTGDPIKWRSLSPFSALLMSVSFSMAAVMLWLPNHCRTHSKWWHQTILENTRISCQSHTTTSTSGPHDTNLSPAPCPPPPHPLPPSSYPGYAQYAAAFAAAGFLIPAELAAVTEADVPDVPKGAVRRIAAAGEIWAVVR